MKHRTLQNNTQDQLSQLISIEAASPLAWSQQDLAELLKHQLDSPLALDLVSAAKSPDSTQALKMFLAAHPAATFADLLAGKNATLDMLNLVKAFAKAAQSAVDAAVPRELAIVLYYAAIAAAAVHVNERATGLSGSDLSAGLAWARGRAWLDPRLASLLSEADEKLQLK